MVFIDLQREKHLWESQPNIGVCGCFSSFLFYFFLIFHGLMHKLSEPQAFFPERVLEADVYLGTKLS